MDFSIEYMEYDIFGVAPNPEPSHPMYGHYKFKHGFEGKIYYQLGYQDCPLEKEMCAYFERSLWQSIKFLPIRFPCLSCF